MNSMRRTNRWRGPVIITALAALLPLTACGADPADSGFESDTVVFADYGGTTRAARLQAFFTGFTTETGVQVVSADADPAKLFLFAENGAAEWDAIDLDAWDVIRFSEQDLLAELPDDVTRVSLVPEEYQAYATGGYNASTGIGYNTETSDAPGGWADFFDTSAFPGKRAVPSFAYFQAEAALLADGVACEDLYPLDFDRAFAKLDTIRDDLLFYDSFGQGIQYLSQKSVALALIQNGRVSAVQDQGLPLGYAWDEAFFTWTASAMPADLPHSDTAAALIDLMSQPETQANFARITKYGPMNPDALDLLDAETLERLPNAHLDVACEPDPAGLAADIDEYNTAYADWLSRG